MFRNMHEKIGAIALTKAIAEKKIDDPTKLGVEEITGPNDPRFAVIRDHFMEAFEAATDTTVEAYNNIILNVESIEIAKYMQANPDKTEQEAEMYIENLSQQIMKEKKKNLPQAKPANDQSNDDDDDANDDEEKKKRKNDTKRNKEKKEKKENVGEDGDDESEDDEEDANKTKKKTKKKQNKDDDDDDDDENDDGDKANTVNATQPPSRSTRTRKK